MADLASFAAEVQKPRKCFTCNLPPDILVQVNEARRADAPLTYTTIAKWLQEEGHGNVSMYNLRNHFQAEHHLDQR